jgi:hypothetical protein
MHANLNSVKSEIFRTGQKSRQVYESAALTAELRALPASLLHAKAPDSRPVSPCKARRTSWHHFVWPSSLRTNAGALPSSSCLK